MDIINLLKLLLIKQIKYRYRLYRHKFAGFPAVSANYYCSSYPMDHQSNHQNELLIDHDSFHFPGPTQDNTIRKASIEIKQQQFQVSPANIPLMHKSFLIQSPSPFKHNISFYQQDQSYLYDQAQNFSIQPRRNGFSTTLNFDESPRKKSFQLSTPSSLRTAAKNPYINMPTSNTKQDKKNSKGLRNLSESVYRIVLDLNVTTYKEVADQLVKKLNAGEFGPLEQGNSKSKDEQNIKRRVYDALNVLISADVLKKNGKYVLSSHQQTACQKQKISSRNGKKEDKDNLYDQIKRKEASIKEKKQRIESLRIKKQILNAIIKRNRKKKIADKEKIVFPLIGITFKKVIPKLIRNESHSKITIPLINSEDVIADMDLLMRAGIDVLNQNIQQIIQEVSEDEGELELSSKRKNKTQPNVSQTRQKISRVLYSL